MSSKTYADMPWHTDGQTNDGNLRHLTDAKGWKSFDERYLDFSLNVQNVRLSLSSDGFNTFKL